MTIKLGIAGLRGTTEAGSGEILGPDVVLDWVRAYGTYLRRETNTVPVVAIARDGRRSSPLLNRLVISGLLSAGCPVIDIGVAPTPTLQLLVRMDRSLQGGVMITASHNPAQWNGLKFLTPDGFLFPMSGWDTLREIREKGDFAQVDLRQIPWTKDASKDALDAHITMIGQWIEAEAIRSAEPRVIIDACNSTAGQFASELASRSGCRVIVIHGEVTGDFSRPPEPLPQNLVSLSHMVQRAEADIGFAFDPDGDRLALVDEQSRPIGEERTIALCARYLLRRSEGDTIVTNVSTTHAIEDLANDADRPVQVIRTPVGEAFVVSGVLQVGPERVIIAGEGSGGVIIPSVNLARDGIAAMGVILSLMATEKKPLSQLVAELPQWQMGKARWDCTDVQAQALRDLTTHWKQSETAPVVQSETGENPALTLSSQGETLRLQQDGSTCTLTVGGQGADEFFLSATLPDPLPHVLQRMVTAGAWNVYLVDGIKIVAQDEDGSPGDAWVHVRSSNTEPIIRLLGEVRENA